MLLEKILEGPLDCKEIHQFTLKEIGPEYSLEGLMLKLKLWQCFGHLIQSVDLMKRVNQRKDPNAGKD